MTCLVCFFGKPFVHGDFNENFSRDFNANFSRDFNEDFSRDFNKDFSRDLKEDRYRRVHRGYVLRHVQPRQLNIRGAQVLNPAFNVFYADPVWAYYHMVMPAIMQHPDVRRHERRVKDTQVRACDALPVPESIPPWGSYTATSAHERGRILVLGPCKFVVPTPLCAPFLLRRVADRHVLVPRAVQSAARHQGAFVVLMLRAVVRTPGATVGAVGCVRVRRAVKSAARHARHQGRPQQAQRGARHGGSAAHGSKDATTGRARVRVRRQDAPVRQVPCGRVARALRDDVHAAAVPSGHACGRTRASRQGIGW